MWQGEKLVLGDFMEEEILQLELDGWEVSGRRTWTKAWKRLTQHPWGTGDESGVAAGGEALSIP